MIHFNFPDWASRAEMLIHDEYVPILSMTEETPNMEIFKYYDAKTNSIKEVGMDKLTADLTRNTVRYLAK